ncbi:MAG: hypothetical protein WB952_17320 [Terriglobales bacterium]
MFDLGAVELALVFQQIKLFRAGDGIHDFNLLSLIEEDAVHADVRIHRDHVVVNEEAFSDSTLVFVPINDVLEVCHRVGGGCRGQTDLDAIKVIESFPPDGTFLS